MTNGNEILQEQQKQFAAANLSSLTIPWFHEMTEHRISAQIGSNQKQKRALLKAAEILGITLDMPKSLDESKILIEISGDDWNKLAAAGGKFAGSEAYADKATWVERSV